MVCLLVIGREPHPIARKYGTPIFAIYWAGRRFLRKGLHVWYRGKYLIAGQWGKRDEAS